MSYERVSFEDVRGVPDCEGTVRDLQDKVARERAAGLDKECQGNYDVEGNGAHYAYGPVECIDAIEAAVEGRPAMEAYLLGQCMKYLWRLGKKGPPALDIKKCYWYLGRLEKHILSREGQ